MTSSDDSAKLDSGRLDPRLPVIIGVGQVVNRTDHGADPLEPAELMIQAARIAEEDSSGSGLLKQVEVVAAVPTVTWRYRDPAAIVAAAHGAESAKTWYPVIGGNTPQMLVNRIASNISSGGLDLALLVGAEAGRARGDAKKAGLRLDWTMQDDSVVPDWSDNSPFLFSDEADMARGLIMPLQLYPLFENALWHHSGRSLDAHMERVARLWSGYSKVAATNPYAWNQREVSPQELLDVTEANRMVAFPYRKLMVANPSVDMASAAIICSVGKAIELGIPTDRWVFIHSGTDAKDRSLSTRADFHHSPAIALAGNLALELADTELDDVAHLDVYSCYPSAVQVAMNALGIGDERQLTVYGGLPFAGGPWNNPVGHAIASMVDVLRDDPGSRGLITANGGNIDKHSFGVYSTDPPTAGFRYEQPQARLEREPSVTAVVDHDGSGVIEGWSVMYDKESHPTSAHIAARISTGERTWATSDDADTLELLTKEDVTGRAVTINGRGTFSIA